MKQTYRTPKMIVHGNLQELTQYTGRREITDVLVFNGQIIDQNDDSVDVSCDVNGNCTNL
ncbi:MAG: lasso peptide [Nostochopsis sp.]